jgi:hypothetical protein
MINAEKQASGRLSRSSVSGTNRSRRTRVEESRVSRLHRRSAPKGSLIRKPFLDYGLEIRTALVFLGVFAVAGGAWAFANKTGSLSTDTNAGLILPFSLGFLVVCACSSTAAFLVLLRHKLLLLAGVSLVVAIGAMVMEGGGAEPAVQWVVLDSAAKVLFATSMGLWIGLVLTSISQVLLIAGLIIFVDIYSVFLGPTRKIVESGGKLIDYFTINLPVFGAPAISRVGISDIIFFSLFVACTLTYRLRRTITALAMTASFVCTMIVGVTWEKGVPALPLLSIFFLLANADLLLQRFVDEPDDLKRGRR